MTVWILLLAGTLLAGMVMTMAVGAAAIRRVELYRWAAHRRGGSAGASTMLDASGRILRTANAVVTVAVLIAATGLAAVVRSLPWPLGIAVVIFVVVPVVLIVIYAFPRTLGRRWPDLMIERAVPWLDRLGIVFAPFTPAVRGTQRRASLRPFFQAEDAEQLLETDELTVLSGVLTFSERPVREVMTPRTEIVAIREGASLDEVGHLFAESGYSRLPVFRESIDHIAGIVFAFDLMKVAPGASLPLRPVTMAPASKSCADLLFEMQRERRQFAVVLDEYGGTAGIATFEDLLEELVGEIFDEYDGQRYPEGPGVEVVEATGSTPAEEIAARFDVALPSQAETIGGLLARAAGHIPYPGERYTLGGLEFDVVAATPNRVERVLIRRGPVPVIPLRAEAG